MLKLRVYGFSHFPVINLVLKSRAQMLKSKPLQKAKVSNLEKVLISIAKLMSMAIMLILYGIF
jgi:hypothetical protein